MKSDINVKLEGATNWSQASPPDRTSPKQIALECAQRILSLARNQGSSVAEFCKIEAQIGAEYSTAKAALREGDSGMEAGAEEHLPGFSWRRIQYCAKFAGQVEQFDPAHDWYVGLKLADRRAGWKTANETGARYGRPGHRTLPAVPRRLRPAAAEEEAEAEGKSRAAALDEQLGEATAILAEAEAKVPPVLRPTVGETPRKRTLSAKR